MVQKSYNIVVCVTGCIAAYKAPEVIRSFQKKGCNVRVVMSKHASEFVGVKTFEALTGYPPLVDLFDYPQDPIAHTTLAKWADATVVVPATANVMAKCAHGMADDAISTYLLACYTPRIFAPAMNTHMLENPATQRNLQILKDFGDTLVMPEWGALACGDIGKGHLANIETIVRSTFETLEPQRQDLAGKKVLITAGPTREYFDPVRFISNPSTGKMGLSLAEAARRRGASVDVVLGPVESADVHPAISIHPVVSAQLMHDETQKLFADADILICTAAVADFRPETTSDHKIKKSHEASDESSVKDIRFIENPDILAFHSALNNDRYAGAKCVVGFAAETDHVLEHASDKLKRKGCTLLVVNDVSNPQSTFGSETNKVSILSKDGAEDIALMDKRELAHVILNRALQHLK